MAVHQVYAMIYNNEVKNVFICDNYDLANYLARATYGEEAIAVDCQQYSCSIGCKYIAGKFYFPDGTEIEYTPTQEQQVLELQSENTELQHALTEQYEQNLALESTVTDTQLAITEIYEGMGV